MCTVSMVITDWQNPSSPNHIPQWQPSQPLPYIVTPDLAAQMLEVLKRLDAIDKKLGALDCKLKEPAKKKIISQLKRRARSRK